MSQSHRILGFTHCYRIFFTCVIALTLTSSSFAQIVDTFAGGGNYNKGPAKQTPLYFPQDVIIDGQTLYLSEGDWDSGAIRQIDFSTNIVTTLLGGVSQQEHNPDGPPIEWFIGKPGSILLDENDLYFTTTNLIKRFNLQTQQLDIVAGGGENSEFNIPATDASLQTPNSLDQYNGHLYFLDTDRQMVLKMNLETNNLERVAGGVRSSDITRGDGGPAIEAELLEPSALLIHDSTLYVADDGDGRIRQIDLNTGYIYSFAGTINRRVATDDDGVDAGIAKMHHPYDLTVHDGKLYFIQGNPNPIRYIDLQTNTIDTFPSDLVMTSYRTAVEIHNNKIYALAENQIYTIDLSTYEQTRYAGYDGSTYQAEGFYAKDIYLNDVFDLAHHDESLYFVYNNRSEIYRIDMNTSMVHAVAGHPWLNGQVTENTPAIDNGLLNPSHIHTSHGKLYISDQGLHRIFEVDLETSLMNTIAGTGESGFSGDDGPAIEAQFNQPADMFRYEDDLYIADNNNHRVRKIDLTTDIITTVAGNGEQGYSGDGGPATEASLQNPVCVFVHNNVLYIADKGNNCIRQVDLTSGTITTLVVNGDAVIQSPSSIIFKDNDLYLTSSGGNKIHRLNLETNEITTIAGNGGLGYSGDGGPAIEASFSNPNSIIFVEGDLYIADTSNQRIRRIDWTTVIQSWLMFE